MKDYYYYYMEQKYLRNFFFFYFYGFQNKIVFSLSRDGTLERNQKISRKSLSL